MSHPENPLRPAALARKIIKGVVGGAIVLAGIVMLVTPGPGIVAIVVGLSILATEFSSARRALDKLKSKVPRRRSDAAE